MTKGEWSGWMQAIGAVVGLGIAIWVSGSHERIEKRSAVIQARAFSKELVIAIQAMSYSAQRETRGMLVMSIVGLNESVALNQSMRPELMPEEAMQAFRNLKINAAMVLKAANAFEAKLSPENSAEFQEMLQYYAGLVAINVKTLHKRHGAIPAENFDMKVAADSFIASANSMMAAAQDAAASKI